MQESRRSHGDTLSVPPLAHMQNLTPPPYTKDAGVTGPKTISIAPSIMSSSDTSSDTSSLHSQAPKEETVILPKEGVVVIDEVTLQLPGSPKREDGGDSESHLTPSQRREDQ